MINRIREVKGGELSLIANFHYKITQEEYNFNPSIEKYFIAIACEYFDDLENNRFWVIEDNNEIIASIGILKIGENKAQIRLFAVDESIQGQGVGSKLMDIAMDYCAEKGFNHVILETIDVCKAARHIYDKYGFKRTGEKENNEWADYTLIEELWEAHFN